jgi:hypothetical protein
MGVTLTVASFLLPLANFIAKCAVPLLPLSSTSSVAVT